MRGKQAGAEVTLTIRPEHWHGQRPIEGEFLETPAGSGYLVVDVRGPRLRCIKVEPATIPEDAIVHHMEWLPRGRRR